ncbi:MAG TPA: nucleoside deaminase [Bryobacteraceae bacterium]|nr:nucleoside deaminase [Bryobacteraceae bacterium]
MANDLFLNEAIREAKLGLAEGGIPIGSVLVCDGRIIGRGHNRRVQSKSAILHGEMDCLENAGRLTAATYARCTIYTTLSPCSMCSGAIVLYRIPRVVVGENRTFLGAEEYVRSHGIYVEVVQDPECIELMQHFIAEHSDLWNEDIGI